MRNRVKSAAVIVAMGSTGAVQAQSTWSGGAGNWSSNANPGWNTTGVPNLLDATANIGAASGTITVNGSYTLGTLTVSNAAAGLVQRTLSGSGTSLLTFDVAAGDATINLADDRLIVNATTAFQLNDNLLLTGSLASGTVDNLFNQKVSGTGKIIVENTGAGGNVRLTLSNAATDFLGGVDFGVNTSLTLTASGAAGTGTITRTATNATGGLSFTTVNQTHSNNINLGIYSAGPFPAVNIAAGLTVTLNGALSGTLGGNPRIYLNNGGSLVLGGASPNTYTGQIRLGNGAGINTVTADKVSALSGGIGLRTNAVGGTMTVLFGVADTVTSLISVDGNDGGTGIGSLFRIGLKDGNNGTVTLNNATKINLHGAWGIGGTSNILTTTSLNLHSGNGTGTLAVSTEIGQNSDARSIEITGTGTVNLNRVGGNTYTGTTTVSGGTLLANNSTGSATGTGAVTVASGAALGGAGFISGPTTVNGSVRPGNSIGTLTVANDVTWNAGNNWVFELGTAASTLALANTGSSTQDLLNLTVAGSDFFKGTGTAFTFDFAGTGADGWYKIVDWTGTTGFVASDFVATNLSAGGSAAFTVDSGTSALFVNVVIPEPASISIVALGALAALRRRRAV